MINISKFYFEKKFYPQNFGAELKILGQNLNLKLSFFAPNLAQILIILNERKLSPNVYF
jgi:hypothetical protein